MPRSLEELADEVSLPAAFLQRIADAPALGDRPFRDVVDRALELLGGVVPQWPVLEAWNRWCFKHGMSFLVWQPHPRDLDERVRLEAFVHTLGMLAAKRRNIDDYRRAGIREAEVVMAGDDCPICEEHRHHVVPLETPPLGELPPFHPGCRCGTLPRLE
jgi:hypothetical protein